MINFDSFNEFERVDDMTLQSMAWALEEEIDRLQYDRDGNRTRGADYIAEDLSQRLTAIYAEMERRRPAELSQTTGAELAHNPLRHPDDDQPFDNDDDDRDCLDCTEPIWADCRDCYKNRRGGTNDE